MTKIGILYIGIGRYACFWPEFYNSCETNLVPEAEKHYYVFTDQTTITPSDRVEVFHQDDMGWPCNSLLRFQDVLPHQGPSQYQRLSVLLQCHTLRLLAPLPPRISFLQTKTSRPSVSRPIQRRCRMNTALSQQPVYRLGVPNTTIPVPSMVERHSLTLTLLETCNAIVDTDLSNGIMPIWHDESVINKFLADKNYVKVMYREMGKPANWKEPRNAKIILRRKGRCSWT